VKYEKIVSLFDTAEHAEAARKNLEAAGFPSSELSVVSNKVLTASARRFESRACGTGFSVRT
jgi:hypothetical protein